MIVTQTQTVSAKANAVSTDGDFKNKKKHRRSSIPHKMSGRADASPEKSPTWKKSDDLEEPEKPRKKLNA